MVTPIMFGGESCANNVLGGHRTTRLNVRMSSLTNHSFAPKWKQSGQHPVQLLMQNCGPKPTELTSRILPRGFRKTSDFTDCLFSCIHKKAYLVCVRDEQDSFGNPLLGCGDVLHQKSRDFLVVLASRDQHLNP